MAVSKKVAEAYVDLVARTESFKKSLDEATAMTRQWSGAMREETQKSRETIRLLSEDLGLHIPRGLQNIISRLPGFSTAFAAAFDTTVVFAMLDVLFKVGKEIYECAQRNEEAASKSRQAWTALSKGIGQTNLSLELTKSRLEDSLAKLEHKPGDGLKTALIEAAEAAGNLGSKLQEDLDKVLQLTADRKIGIIAGMFGGGHDSVDQAALSAIEQIESINDELNRQKKAAALSGDSAGYASAQARAEQAMAGDPVLNKAIAELTRASELGLRGDEATSRAAHALDLISGALQAIVAQGGNERIQSQIAELKAAPAPGPLVPGQYPFMSHIGQAAWAWTGQMSQYAADDATAAQVTGPLGGPAALPNTSGWNGSGPTVVSQSIFRTEMDDMFRDWINQTTSLKDVTHALFEDLRRGVDSFNDEIVKFMSGEKTDWRGAARGTAQSFAKTGLNMAEGDLMKALGFGGGGKPDGSRGNRLHVSTESEDSGAGAAHAVGDGLLGMLNNSDWASSLFGGKLFGAGSFFGGGHALGGAVPAGIPIDVGELGRERFIPQVPGRIVSNRDLGNGGPTFNIDARGTDPALTRENFQRALAQVHSRAVADAARTMYEHSRRVAR